MSTVTAKDNFLESLGSTRVVFSRELGSYFDSPIASVHAAVFLLLGNGIFMNRFFLAAVVDMSPYFATLPWLLLLFVPAITMRAWAEERADGTHELLLTLPLRSTELILGKFLAALAFLLLTMLGSLPIVLMLAWLGEPDLGAILSSYMGSAMLGALFLACGQFTSSLTRDQVVALVLSVFACSLFVVSGHQQVVEVLDGLTPTVQVGTWLKSSFSALPRYENACRGLLRLADLGYFALMIAFFLGLSGLVLRQDRQ